MNIESLSKELYLGIEQSQLAVANFSNILNNISNKNLKNEGELQIAYNTFVNLDLLKTNSDMLNDEIFFSDKKDPNRIILLNESYLTKLGAIGTLTLEQIACSLMGEYDPLNPGKKVKLNRIKDVVQNYAGPELESSFFEGFLGIFNEVKGLRNKAAHSNLTKEIFIQEQLSVDEILKTRKWVVNKPLYGSEPQKKKMYGFIKGTLMLDKKETSSLTEKLNEFGSKYLKMVTDVYSGLSNYKKSFITEGMDLSPRELKENPFKFKL